MPWNNFLLRINVLRPLKITCKNIDGLLLMLVASNIFKRFIERRVVTFLRKQFFFLNVEHFITRRKAENESEDYKNPKIF